MCHCGAGACICLCDTSRNALVRIPDANTLPRASVMRGSQVLDFRTPWCNSIGSVAMARAIARADIRVRQRHCVHGAQ
eukprot:6178984-Pleurochrysis_carterae.AAC.2